MLEIIAIVTLGKHISKIVRAKGLKPTKYVIIMVVLWIGLEIIGSICGTLLIGEGLAAYPFALAGAALGGFIAYSIAKNASAATNLESDEILDLNV
ncbi:hypothetical protein [Flexithrix dorotheae]|uniref:hypothetical protein n=1 Tax=Flexithrix dorotheae TaxID=70993 RepID=UPI00036FAEDF|nr:hypothetical protein [Flexithrix dorotheae]